MRVRILDPGGLLNSAASLQNPRLLHVFAGEAITRTHIPLQLAPSSTVANAFEAAVVIPLAMQWNVGMSSMQAYLLDSNGNPYQPNTAIPRPSDYGNNEFLAVYTLRSN